MEVKKIYKKIQEVQNKVSFVKKDGQLGFGNNKFSIVTHDAVLRAVRSHLLDAGIIIIPTQVEKGTSVVGATKSGTAKIRFEALYDVKFICIEDGSEVIIRVEAHAEDSSDKAANKAITYATKNAMLKMFLLETGDDNNQEQQNLINLNQVQAIQKIVELKGIELKDFTAGYGVEKLSELQQGSFSHAMENLNLLPNKGAK